MRSHITAALFTALAVLLTAFYLISTLGIPDLAFLHLRYDNGDSPISSTPQIPLGPPQETDVPLHRHIPYLLGVGKADITGYVLTWTNVI